MLSTALKSVKGVLNTPTTRYIRKLVDETERLNTRHFLHEREVDNLRSIIQKRREQTKGKRAILKGQYHISTEDLRSQVVEAEAATTAASQKSKTTTVPLHTNGVISTQIDEEDEEEEYDSEIDELRW